METKHTPGPWMLHPVDNFEWSVDAPSGDPDLGYGKWESLAVVYGCEDEPQIGERKGKCNALLIAAAPELLDALKACIDHGSMTGDDWVTDKALAAIAKATHP